MAVKDSILTLERLKQLLHYDPETGAFTRIAKKFNEKIGSVNNRAGNHGYIRISVDGKLYLAHRVAWLYINGEWPNVIDHINGNRTDNRLENLRSVTTRVNSQNRKSPPKHNRSGLMGAKKVSDNSWRAIISIGGKQRNIGSYKTPEEAHFAYLSIKRQMHAGCTV